MVLSRQELLDANSGSYIAAAAEFAQILNTGQPEVHQRAAYSRANAILAAAEMFPEVADLEKKIRHLNRWPPIGDPMNSDG